MKNSISHNPYAELLHIDVVKPFSEEDQPFIDEIHAVMKKYGKTDRFGLSLLHKHFEVNEGEMLLETCDPERRSLMIQPQKMDKMDAPHLIETNWRFDQGARLVCWQVCKGIEEHLAEHHYHWF